MDCGYNYHKLFFRGQVNFRQGSVSPRLSPPDRWKTAAEFELKRRPTPLRGRGK